LAGYSFSSKLDLALYTDQNQVPSFEGACTAPQLDSEEIVVGKLEKSNKNRRSISAGYIKQTPKDLRIYTTVITEEQR
jgi:hypothetical protein